LWQYEYEFAVPVEKVWDSMRYLHYYVVKDPMKKDPTSHVIKLNEELKDGSSVEELASSSESGLPVLLVVTGAVFTAVLSASAFLLRWRRRASLPKTLATRLPNEELDGESPPLQE